ncbi:hypothetical protein K435DRAFT_421365 [Dendrothele bispora CBS 962.96]|uniref:Uncharacterized protein n=1 Tax=Dendrothele bispora (strain CBS 962.96) TaxID=1314807 RepID=A0A4S8MFS1_DENBC|nr:hypothetical protein K435DRAFT_421365 [Dendrothele bispora CBS 962.96]
MRGFIAIPLPSPPLLSPLPPEMAERTPSSYNCRELTPPPRSGPVTIEQSTPQSAYISSQPLELYRRYYKVSPQKEWLKEDLRSTVLVNRETFNDLVLGAKTRVGTPETDTRFHQLLDEFIRTNAEYKNARAAYLEETEKDEKRKEKKSKDGESNAEKPRLLEKHLYNLFVTLCNVVIEGLPGLEQDESPTNVKESYSISKIPRMSEGR